MSFILRAVGAVASNVLTNWPGRVPTSRDVLGAELLAEREAEQEVAEPRDAIRPEVQAAIGMAGAAARAGFDAINGALQDLARNIRPSAEADETPPAASVGEFDASALTAVATLIQAPSVVHLTRDDLTSAAVGLRGCAAERDTEFARDYWNTLADKFSAAAASQPR